MNQPGVRIREIKDHAIREKKPIFLLGDEVPEDFDVAALNGRCSFCAQSPTWLLEEGIDKGIVPNIIVCGNRADIAAKSGEWIELLKRVGSRTSLIFADPSIAKYIQRKEDVAGCRIVGFTEMMRSSPHFFDDDPKVHENPPLWFAMKVCAMLRHRPIVILDTEDCDDKTKEAEEDGADIFGASFLQWGRETDKIRAVIPRIVLITQFYLPEKRRRAQELQKVLRNNLNNRYIDEIVLLNEERFTDVDMDLRGGESSRITQKIIGHRLTQETAFRQARDELDDNCIVILANADIQFEDSLRQLFEVNMEGHVFALLRFEESTREGEPHQIFGPRPDSQDAWIFSSRIPGNLNLESLRIPLGIGGCDNAVLSPLSRAGYKLVNPAGSIQAIHVHASGVRTWKNQPPVPAKEQIMLPPTFLGDFDVVNDITPYMDRIIEPEDSWNIPVPVQSHEIRTYMNYAQKSFGVKVDIDGNIVEITHEILPGLFKFENTSVGAGGIMYSLKDNKSQAQKSIYSGLNIRILSEVVPSHALQNPLQPGQESQGSFALQILPKLVWWSRQEEAKHTPALCPFNDNLGALLKSFDMNKLSVSIYNPTTTYYNNVVYHTEALNKETVNRDWLLATRRVLKEGWRGMIAPRVCVIVCDGPIFGDEENKKLLVDAVCAKQGGWRVVCVDGGDSAKSRRAFAQAHTVISQTSEHLGNMLFAPESCRIIQIQQEENPRVLEWFAAAALGLRQALLPVKREPARRQAEMVVAEIGEIFDKLGDPVIAEGDFINMDPDTMPTAGDDAGGNVPEEGDELDVQEKLFMKKGGDILESLAGGDNAVSQGVQEREEGAIVIRGVAKASPDLRGLLEAWKSRGYVTFADDDAEDFVWFGGHGGALICEERGALGAALKGVEFRTALLGQTPHSSSLEGRIRTWVNMAGHAEELEEWGKRGRLGYGDRGEGVVFMGHITDKKSLMMRAGKKWNKVCDRFELVAQGRGREWSEYMDIIGRARWGLCLPGGGGKSSREVEQMAVGTPLIITRGVGTEYASELKEGVHQLFAESPDDVVAVTAAVSDADWERMSAACRDQWREHWSVEGAWKTTLGCLGIE